MFWLRFAMIQIEPAATRSTMRMPASARTLLVLSGPVVMCRKNTRCTPIWAIARTASPRSTPGAQSSDVLATQNDIAVRATARTGPIVWIPALLTWQITAARGHFPMHCS